jgi:hypothetical protein
VTANRRVPRAQGLQDGEPFERICAGVSAFNSMVQPL